MTRDDAETTIHHVSHRDAFWLMEHFAVLTPDGWAVPEWVLLLVRTVRSSTNRGGHVGPT